MFTNSNQAFKCMFIKKTTLKHPHTTYVHILCKHYLQYKVNLRFKLNDLPLTILFMNINCCKQRCWHTNRQTKWYDSNIYRLLPIVVEYFVQNWKLYDKKYLIYFVTTKVFSNRRTDNKITIRLSPFSCGALITG